MFHTFSHCHQDLLQRSEALQMLVDVQMEAEGWGREQRAGALAGLSVTSAQSLMQVRGRRSTEAESSRRALLPLRPPPPCYPPSHAAGP